VELTIKEIEELISDMLPTGLYDKLNAELNRLKNVQERHEKELRYSEIIIYELKKKYPDKLKNTFYRREDEWGLEIVIEDHELYYTREFTEFLGYLTYQYLIPNEIYGISFVVDYSDKIKLTDEEKKELEIRAEECESCYMMIHHEDPDKWGESGICPRCGKSTEIIRKSWDE
jgi:predicted RNA-binding Zn-ribbon protein involved in translation (DUF1610 family)